MLLTGDGNPHRYFVASQDPELKSRLRAVPGKLSRFCCDAWQCSRVPNTEICAAFHVGSPLLHIVQNTVVLEGPSDCSHQKADEVQFVYHLNVCVSHHDRIPCACTCIYATLQDNSSHWSQTHIRATSITFDTIATIHQYWN